MIRQRTKTLILFVAFGVLLTACTAPVLKTPPASLALPSFCLPTFPDADGWYGGDGAYSIALDGHRTLWLFGDTFASAEKERKNRAGMDLILGNTLAISTCSEEGQFHIQYYLNRKDGKFVSSFGTDEWLWPQDPFLAGGILYLPLMVIRTLPDLPSPFNFKIAGHKVVRITDYSAENPHQWPKEMLDWTNALAPGIEALATTSIVHEDYVYFYPLYRHADKRTILSGNLPARISIRHLDQPAGHFEYWTSDNVWQKNLPPEKVRLVFPAALSELSVRYFPKERKWIAVYLSPQNRGDRLLCATADEPQGPWSQPSVLMDKIPEVTQTSSLYNSDNFCYAGKEHSQFRQNHQMIVTYVCNSLAAEDHPESFIRQNLFLYRPVVKSLPSSCLAK
ncbi:MAG TPA: DUF4185 domain-containing protein [Smithellaceae bacterium]|nr:DUF4185 domain-containing protein [Smithellaceae bacterium]